MKNLQRLGAFMIVIAATFLVYWPAQRNGFVWDDTALVERDPLIRSWRLIPESFRHFLFLDATASNFYRPLQRLTFTADYALWDRSARGWHLTSIYVHLAAALALFALAERLLGSLRWAAAVALLWAIHPLHTSAVTYTAGRADPLQALFGFGALALGLQTLGAAPGSGGASRSRSISWLLSVGAAVCFLGAMLSKEAGIAALLIWFALLAWRRVPRGVWLRWLGLGAAVLAIYGGLRFSAEKTPPPRDAATPLMVRPILAARGVAEYAGLILAPVNLRMERDVSSGVGPMPERLESGRRREAQTLLGCALIAVGIAWWRWTKRRAPVAAFALIAALIAYLPISNLFALNATVAEHWLYVPLAFFFIAVAAALREVRALGGTPSATGGTPVPPKKAGRTPAPLLFAGVVAVAIWAVWLGSLTWRRQADWRNQRTFIMRTIEAGGDTARMRINLGKLESAEGQDELALEQFREALRRAPDQPLAHFGAAAVLIRLQRFEEAEPFLAEAEKHASTAVECVNLRTAILRLKTGADTSAQLRAAAENAPRNWPAWRRYFAELARTGQHAAALRELRAFLERQPFRAESWKMLGEMLANAHDYPRAIEAFTEAARLDVHDQESRDRIAIIRRSR